MSINFWGLFVIIRLHGCREQQQLTWFWCADKPTMKIKRGANDKMPKKGENIYKRKDSRWEGRYRKGTDPSGKTQFGYVYGKTYKEVQDKLVMLKKAQENTHKADSAYSFKKISQEWLAKEHLTTKASTYNRYVFMLEKHILPEFGNKNTNNLTFPVLNAFIEGKLQNGRLDHTGGLSPKTVHDIYVIIRSILKYAECEYHISNHLQPIALQKHKKPHINVLTPEHLEKLETFLQNSNSPDHLGILLCLYTGLRLGEICALRWENIDLTLGILKIDSTLQRIQNSEATHGTKTQIICEKPKSPSSRREIPIPDFLLERLRETNLGTDPDFYFLTGTSQFMEPRTYQNHFKTYLESNQIPYTNFHTLRHTFATRCTMAGVDAKSLSEILGHSTVQMTLNYYVHTSIDEKKRQMEMICGKG